MTLTAGVLALVCVVALACSLLLGLVVRRGQWALDTFAARLVFGRGVSLAIVFTRSGFARTIGLQLVVLALLALVFHRGLVEVVVLALAQTLGQLVINYVFKPLFTRARPEEFRFRREGSHAYPSGHAATGVIFYGGIALLAPFAFHDQPVAIDIVRIVAVGWGLGVMWSRIALGAHYATDVLGGALYGIGWSAGALALAHAAGISV